MDIAIPLYDRFTALDAVGPYEVLSRLPGAERDLRSPHEPGPVSTDNGHAHARRRRRASRTCPTPRSCVVPGGIGTRAVLDDERLVGWIRRAHETIAVDDLGLHRLAAARRRRRARRPRAPPPTGSTSRRSSATARRRSGGAWSSRARWSPRPACRPGSTWRSTLAAQDRRATRSRRRSSCGSSTTPSRPSTPARPQRPRPRSSSWSGPLRRRETPQAPRRAGAHAERPGRTR